MPMYPQKQFCWLAWSELLKLTPKERRDFWRDRALFNYIVRMRGE